MPIKQSWFKVQPERFIASVQDINEKEQEWGSAIVVEVLPLGESVARPIFFSASNPTSPRSKWQKWLKAWKDVGVKPEGPNDLIGKIAMFEQVPQTYKIDGETVESTFTKPIKTYQSEADAIPDMDAMSAGDTGDVSDEDVPAPVELREPTDDEVEQGMNVFRALGESDENFMGVAKSSYPEVDPLVLLEEVKARIADEE